MSALITITSVTLPSTDAEALMAQLDAELEQRYPQLKHRQLSLTSTEFSVGRGVFLLASAGGVPVGCCALRRLGSATGEIRRMYVVPSARGTGVGARLLVEVDRHAREGGLERLTLATGLRQPEAIRLYEKHGFIRVQCPYGTETSRLSVCMTKVLIGDYRNVPMQHALAEPNRA